MLEYLTAAAALIAAFGSLWNTIEIRALRSQVDRFSGRVEAVETAHSAHVNTPGLHGAR